jgi:hypothetical protein
MLTKIVRERNPVEKSPQKINTQRRQSLMGETPKTALPHLRVYLSAPLRLNLNLR